MLEWPSNQLCSSVDAIKSTFTKALTWWNPDEVRVAFLSRLRVVTRYAIGRYYFDMCCSYCLFLRSTRGVYDEASFIIFNVHCLQTK